MALAASVATWFAAVWVIGMFGNGGLAVQAATGIPAIIVLLIVMNWFFHRMYWPRAGSRTTTNAAAACSVAMTGGARCFWGSDCLGSPLSTARASRSSSSSRACGSRSARASCSRASSSASVFTAAVGVITFVLHQHLPYKRLLIITGVLLVAVLWVMVGEEMNEMQLAGWIGTTNIAWMHLPGWAGTWFSIFPNVQTWLAQFVAVALVVGSYLAAQYVRVCPRPRRRGLQPGRLAERPPAQPAPRISGAPSQLPA